MPFVPSSPDITANNHGGHPNSVAANQQTNKQRDAARIYAHVHHCGLKGATCDEVEVALDMLHQTASARFSDLKRDGHLIDTGQRRNTRRGRCQAAVFITAGIARLSP